MELLPESFGQLAALQNLDFIGNGTLKSLPESFGQLAALQNLELRAGAALVLLPESFGQLAAGSAAEPRSDWLQDPEVAAGVLRAAGSAAER